MDRFPYLTASSRCGIKCLFVFVLAVAAILIMPGPTNALLCASAGLIGIRRSLPLILAGIGGYLVTIVAILAFAGPVLLAIPSLGLAVRLMLVAYLLFLAWRLWHADPASQGRGGKVISFGQVFVTTMLNPKAMVFAFAIFPPLASARATMPYLAVFAATAAVVSCVWLSLGGAAGRLGEHFACYLPRAAALAVSLFAVILVGSTLAAQL
jgi:threonine/homoserine/homoserine lactone efflux protein